MKKAAAILGALWFLSVLLFLQPGLVRPDGAGYLVYLPSAWLDRDLLFFDEWQQLGMIRDGIIQHKNVTATEHLGNHWTVGSALAWLPAFGLADLLRPDAASRTGFSLPYNVAVIFTSAVAGLVTLLASWQIARRNATDNAATIASIGAWLGTPLLWYSLIHATMSHAISAMACALVMLAAISLRDKRGEWAWLLAGLAAGFACTVRPQNAPFALVPFFFVRPQRRELGAYVIGGLAAALPQLIVSGFLYGSPIGFLTGGANATPFAAFQRIWPWEPLLSWYHGLFTWTPFALLGVIGIALLWRIDKRLAAACLFVFVAEWLINATLERSFWGAMSFGQRRFDNCTVIFAIGAAMTIARIGRIAGIAVVSATSLWTLSLVLAARRGLDLVAYVAPRDLFAAQWDALRSPDLSFFGTVRAEGRTTMMMTMFACAVLFSLIALAWRAMSERGRALSGLLYLATVSAFLMLAGANDASRIEQYRALIERNRIFESIPGGADVRFGLLENELDYLRRSGRESEATRTERELQQLQQERDAAIRALMERR